MQLVESLWLIVLIKSQVLRFTSAPIEWLHDARVSWNVPNRVDILLGKHGSTTPNRYLDFTFVLHKTGKECGKLLVSQLNFWSQSRLEALGLTSKRKPGIRNRKKPTIFFEKDLRQEACLLYAGHGYHLYVSVGDPGPKSRQVVDEWFGSIRLHSPRDAGK